MLLSFGSIFGSIVSRKTHDVIQAALTSIPTRAVTQWCHSNLGITLQAQRAFAFEGNKNSIQNGHYG